MAALKYRNDIETDVFKRYFISFASKLASYKKGYDSIQIELDTMTIQHNDLQHKNKYLEETVIEQKNKISEQNNALKLLLDVIKETENTSDKGKI
jgi:competence CoiA-like predicted nuclease